MLASSLVLALPGFAATVTGTIVDPAGKPVPGASIALVELESGVVFPFRQAPAISLTSDRSGGFSAEMSDGTRSGGFGFSLDDAVARVRVQAKGYAPSDAALRAGTNTIVLAPPTTIRGYVFDMRHQPVSGVEVRWLGLLDSRLTNTLTVEGISRDGFKNVAESLSRGLPALSATTGPALCPKAR